MEQSTIDPICGMVGHIPKHGQRFCSNHCIIQYEQQLGLTPSPSQQDTSSQGNRYIVYILLFVLLGGGFLSWYFDVMSWFMGFFLICVAVLKLWDLPGFAQAYHQYDLLARSWKQYGYIYPFIELGLGIGFLFQWQMHLLAGVTIIIMLIGIIGITQSLLAGKKFRCACLGTKINVPLTNLTIVEDLLMIIMSIMILFA